MGGASFLRRALLPARRSIVQHADRFLVSSLSHCFSVTGELLDGQRGLVPSNFVEFVQDKEKTIIPSEEGGEEIGLQDHRPPSVLAAIDIGTSQECLLSSANALVPCSNGTPLDTEDLAEDIVPYPQKISLIKQLARSVIVAWEPPLVPLRGGNISGYNVLVDGELRAHVGYGSRTKCLLEKLDLDGCVYRVSVQSVTDRGLSDELRCTVLVGANVVVAPCGLRVDDIQRDTAELSWLPSNSNYAHTIFLDGVEYTAVKPGKYRLRFVNLKPLTVYKVTVVAQPHQVPWQLPLEQRERKEAGVEFCTQAAGQNPVFAQIHQQEFHFRITCKICRTAYEMPTKTSHLDHGNKNDVKCAWWLTVSCKLL